MKPTFFLFISLIAVLSLSCDDNESSLQVTGTVTIEFDNQIGKEQLELNTEYTNAIGEAFSISKLNYYISNVILTTTGGHEFVVPQDSSYFLVLEEEEASQNITLKNIPAGDYNRVSFTIGVDSLRSTMDITKRQGALDPAQGHDGMYWTWNSGYIFFKMEGTSPAAPAEQENKFYYHIGGYGGYETPSLNNIRETTINMGNAVAQVRSGKAPQIHIHVDVLELFENPTLISIAQNPTVMFSDYSRTVSANYVNMFKYDHVHN